MSYAMAALGTWILSCGGELVSQTDGGTSSGGSGGSSSGSSSSSGGSSGGSNGSASGSFVFVPCPTTAPTPGAPCTTPAHGCAYVDDNTGTCQAFVCGSSPMQVWSASTGGC